MQSQGFCFEVFDFNSAYSYDNFFHCVDPTHLRCFCSTEAKRFDQYQLEKDSNRVKFSTKVTKKA